MRQMMLDGVEFPASCLAREGLFQKTANVRARAAIADTTEHQIDVWALGQEIRNLAQELARLS